MMQPFNAVSRIEHAGLDGLILYFSDNDTQATSARVSNCHQALKAASPIWLREAIPSFDSLLVIFDPYAIDDHGVYQFIHQLPVRQDNVIAGKHHRIPVWYGAPEANDLEDIARLTGLSKDGIINTHTATTYRVYAVGFAPGFAYLGDSADSLNVPRRQSPRTAVPVGAVALADKQSAVYPQRSPGGWQLLGLTPVAMFRPGAEQPALLNMGDTVSFYGIDEDTFRQWDIQA